MNISRSIMAGREPVDGVDCNEFLSGRRIGVLETTLILDDSAIAGRAQAAGGNLGIRRI